MAGSRPDGLDEDVWARLVEIVTAANRGDADAHAVAVLAFAKRVPLPGHRQAGAYLLYLLYHQVKAVFGRVPREEGLHDLAVSTYPRVREVVVTNETLLEETFRRALQLPASRVPLTIGEFMLFGSAALGVLLRDPLGELEKMRPGLAVWMWRIREAFPGVGVGG